MTEQNGNPDQQPPIEPEPQGQGPADAKPERMVTVMVVKQSISHGGIVSREGDTLSMTASDAKAYGKKYVSPVSKQQKPPRDKQVTGGKNK